MTANPPSGAPVPAAELDVEISAGHLHAIERGPASGEPVLCLPGLTANARGFDLVAERLSERGVRTVALDLRGRGRSTISPPGSYGWPAHARDVLEIADRLGAARVGVIGWSMGAFVALQMAERAPGRLSRVVLIDACASPPAEALPPIRLAVERLGVVYPSVEEYLRRLRGLATIVPWHPLWDGYFHYELAPAPGGVTPRTSEAAAAEDLAYGETHDPRVLWPALDMPVLLLRAKRPLVPGGSWILSAEDRDAFAREVPRATAAEIDANHYGIMAHPGTADAITRFLTG